MPAWSVWRDWLGDAIGNPKPHERAFRNSCLSSKIIWSVLERFGFDPVGKGEGSQAQVTEEDQQNINKFRRLNNCFHELEDEIKVAKVCSSYGFG